MKVLNLKAITTTIIVLLFWDQSRAQDPLKIAGEIYQGIDQLKDAYNNISSVKEVVNQIEAGKNPSVSGNKWTDLANKYQQSAKIIVAAPLPTDFDQSKFIISASEAECSKLPSLIIKATDYLEALKAAKSRGEDGLFRIDAAIVLADSTRSALDYLIKVHEKLITIPIYNQIFQWDWLVLNTSVSSSLAEFRSALNSQRKKINTELDKLNMYIPNLTSNLELLKGIVCIKSGTYESNDAMHRFKLSINGQICTWIERAANGSEIARTVTLMKIGGQYTISRPNDDDVLTFLGYQPSIKSEILARSPQPSYFTLTPVGNDITGNWFGLFIIKDSNAHLKELKQPGSMAPKTFVFLKKP